MKIIKNECNLNDFIFFKGNITECVIAIYKNPLFMRYFSLPIDKGERVFRSWPSGMVNVFYV